MGGIYAWSVFAAALHEDYGLWMRDTQLVFGICYVAFPVTMVIAGRLQTLYGPRIVGAVGGLLFLIGYLIASMSGAKLSLLILGIGVFGGAAIGFAYVCPIATCVLWFPKHKGLVTGLAVAGFGGGAILLSAIAEILFASGTDVLTIFRWVGLVYGITLVVCANLLFVPERDAEWQPFPRVRIGELLRDRRFWPLFLGVFSGTFTGLMIVGNLKPIGLSGGIAETYATVAISTLAIGNASGRIIWGWISDRLKERSIYFSLFFLSLSVLALIPGVHFGWAFILIALSVGMGFGACFVVYAAAVADLFGGDSIASVYPLVFLGVALSGLFGPATGGWLYDITASYTPTLLLGALFPLMGGVICFVSMRGLGGRTS